MKKYILIIICLSLSLLVSGQKVEPLLYAEAGKPMPDITLRNIQYFPKHQATLDDFRGKWLLLDFWNVHCGACVFNFPHINKIQQQLGDKIQVMLVGIQDERNEIQPMYAKFRDREHLVMPCAFDSIVARRFDIYAAPHSILIDDRGIVRCVTTTFNVDDIRGFLEGDSPKMPKTYGSSNEDSFAVRNQFHFNPDVPYLLNANGGRESDFDFRTVFSSLSGQLHPVYAPSDIGQDMPKGQFQAIGVPLEWLFNFAHFGRGNWNHEDTLFYQVYNHPILETRDSLKFKYSFKYNRQLYAISISFPKERRKEEYVKNYLHQQLTTFLGLSSTVETKDCPVWVLRADDRTSKKLRTKGGSEMYRQLVAHASFTASNWPFSKLIEWVRANQPEKIIFDETGLSGNIDISMDCVPTDLDDLVVTLRRNGLILMRTTKPMKVVVIRDNSSY